MSIIHIELEKQWHHTLISNFTFEFKVYREFFLNVTNIIAYSMGKHFYRYFCRSV